jgi:hypothetical protein
MDTDSLTANGPAVAPQSRGYGGQDFGELSRAAANERELKAKFVVVGGVIPEILNDRSQASRVRGRLPDPVHWADSPGSVPRLRGRGEQG